VVGSANCDLTWDRVPCTIGRKQLTLNFWKLVSKDQSDCLKSLNPFDCETDRDNLVLKRHQNTCSWFLADEHYRDCIENDSNSVLWIHGAPGCGKSVLSSVLSKELCCDESILRRNYSVAYFFCDDKNERLRTESAVLLNLLSQLLRQDQGVLAHFLAESEYAVHKDRTSWNFGMLWRVFDRIVRDDGARPMCVIIDALGMPS
jgi:hypothetical protein